MTWLGIFSVHVHHEMSVRGEESHLTSRVATIGAVCVGLDELSDREPIRCFFGGNAGLVMICFPEFDLCGNEKRVTRGWPSVRETPRSHRCQIRDPRRSV